MKGRHGDWEKREINGLEGGGAGEESETECLRRVWGYREKEQIKKWGWKQGYPDNPNWGFWMSQWRERICIIYSLQGKITKLKKKEFLAYIHVSNIPCFLAGSQDRDNKNYTKGRGALKAAEGKPVKGSVCVFLLPRSRCIIICVELFMCRYSWFRGGPSGFDLWQEDERDAVWFQVSYALSPVPRESTAPSFTHDRTPKPTESCIQDYTRKQ